jgi:hypothetical protein
MENNISMNYKDLIIVLIFFIMILLPIVLVLIFILKSTIHIVITSNISNTDTEVKVSFRYFFNLINITKTVYPIGKSDEKKDKKNNKDKEDQSSFNILNLKKIEIENLVVLYKVIRKVKISEIYSDFSYGSENIQLTSFVYVLVNILYGNIINYFESDKIYLKVLPLYNQSYIKHKGIIHISPTIKDIIVLAKGMMHIYFKISKYKKVKYGKEARENEISKLNKRFNGYNS